MKINNILYKRIITLFLAVIIMVSFGFESYAKNNDSDEKIITKSDTDVMSLEGPTVYVDFGELGSGELACDADGNYSGQLMPRSGVTAITCTMTGYIDSIKNYYEIGIRWTGQSQVNSISATSLTVKSTSILSPVTYWSHSFSISAGSTYSGYCPVGYVVIDPSVTKVKVQTSGLQVYFNNEDYWIKLNEISGTIKLN